MNLAVSAAYGWRSIRAKLALNGLPDPLRQLGSMHALLDLTEQLAVEAKASHSKDEVEKFWFALYQPDPEDEVPADFGVDDQLDAFDAFESMTKMQ